MKKQGKKRFVRGIAAFLGIGPADLPVEKQSERRSHERVVMSFHAEISSATGTLQVQGVDIDRNGVGVLSNLPLAPQSLVFVHVKSRGLLGFAHVRYCSPRKKIFAIGLEFRGEPMRQEFGTWHFQHVTMAA